MKSMTGFGRGERMSDDGVAFSVEIGTVNRKQLDIRVNLPAELSSQEAALRRLVGERVGRGSVSMKVAAALSDQRLGQAVKFNEALAGAYIEKARHLKERFALEGALSLADVLAMPGVVEDSQAHEVTPEMAAALEGAVGAALDDLDKSREAEGGFIKRDLLGRVETMEALLEAIAPLAAVLPEARKAALLKRLEKAELPTAVDDERLLQELVIFADRYDVSEETTRLRSHFGQCRQLLGADGDSVGRNLDFLTQELQREINTLGVKAADSEVTPLVVKFKTEVEKLREQVQNVE